MHMKGICTHMQAHAEDPQFLVSQCLHPLVDRGGVGWGGVYLGRQGMFSEVVEGEVLRRPGLQTFSPILPVSLFEQAVSERKPTDFPEKLLD